MLNVHVSHGKLMFSHMKYPNLTVEVTAYNGMPWESSDLLLSSEIEYLLVPLHKPVGNYHPCRQSPTLLRFPPNHTVNTSGLPWVAIIDYEKLSEVSSSREP